MKELIRALIEEPKKEDYTHNAKDIRKYCLKRNIINRIAEELNYVEKRWQNIEEQGRDIAEKDKRVRGILYSNLEDKVNYCRQYSLEEYIADKKKKLKKALSESQIKKAAEKLIDYKTEIEGAFNETPDLQSRIVGGHIRFVIKEANYFCIRRDDLPDLIQEGCKGLLRALGKYMPGKGWKFTTYATNWVRNYIKRYVKSNRRNSVIRIPDHVYDWMNIIKARLKKMGDSREISHLSKEEMAAIGGMSQSQTETVYTALNSRDMVSLDIEIGEDRDSKLGDLIGKNDAPPSYFLDEKILGVLSKNERNVVKVRYLNKSPKTFEETGKTLGISRQRVQQIEVKALRKLRRFYPSPNSMQDAKAKLKKAR